MPDLQTLGEHAQRRRLVPLEPLDLEQDDILLRLDTGRARGDLTNPEETSDLIAEIGKGSIVELRRGRTGDARDRGGHREREYISLDDMLASLRDVGALRSPAIDEIGRASCRERE